VQRAPEPGPEVESAVLQWEDGYRRLQDIRSEPALYRALGRIVVAVQDELRKRLGSRFSVAELAALYRDVTTDWAFEVGASAPEAADRWDPSVAADAAFYLYMREASDFAGGRARW
jgi:hypothetical protein